MKLLFAIWLVLSGCQKQLDKQPLQSGFASVKFYSDYIWIEGTPIFIKRWGSEYDTAFTKLRFRDTEPFCSDTTYQIFKAAKGVFYAVRYFDKDADYMVDTAFMVKATNTDECVFINLNN